jgi:hypothetical protein
LDIEGRTIWIADAHPRQRKAFRCSSIGQALDSLPQCSDAGRRRSHRSVPSIERDRALKHYAARRPRHPVPGLSQSAAGAAPRCSTQRAGIAPPHAASLPGWIYFLLVALIRLHFRARRSCRRCASDASYESVGNAGSIDVTTSDISLVTDSV